jgi:hypothetical protein
VGVTGFDNARLTLANTSASTTAAACTVQAAPVDVTPPPPVAPTALFVAAARHDLLHRRLLGLDAAQRRSRSGPGQSATLDYAPDTARGVWYAVAAVSSMLLGVYVYLRDNDGDENGRPTPWTHGPNAGTQSDGSQGAHTVVISVARTEPSAFFVALNDRDPAGPISTR